MEGIAAFWGPLTVIQKIGVVWVIATLLAVVCILIMAVRAPNEPWQRSSGELRQKRPTARSDDDVS